MPSRKFGRGELRGSRTAASDWVLRSSCPEGSAEAGARVAASRRWGGGRRLGCSGLRVGAVGLEAASGRSPRPRGCV